MVKCLTQPIVVEEWGLVKPPHCAGCPRDKKNPECWKDNDFLASRAEFDLGNGTKLQCDQGACSDGMSWCKELDGALGNSRENCYSAAYWFHDCAYRLGGDKHVADHGLRDLCLTAGVSHFRADIIYAGVHLGGFVAYNGYSAEDHKFFARRIRIIPINEQKGWAMFKKRFGLALFICTALALLVVVGCVATGPSGTTTTQQSTLLTPDQAWNGYILSMTAQTIARDAGKINDKDYTLLELARALSYSVMTARYGPPPSALADQVTNVNLAWARLAPVK